MSARLDLAVVGAGILGRAHALAAARASLRVVVIDRDARANGASIRNFGFVTGQEAGACLRLARRSRAIRAEAAGAGGLPLVRQGLLVTARRPEAEAASGASDSTVSPVGSDGACAPPRSSRSRPPCRRNARRRARCP